MALPRAEASSQQGNKILWVAKVGNGIGSLRIAATERTSGRTTTVVLPDGPGPSYVDMPAPGCWRFVLSWDNQQDTLFVRYFPTPA